LCSTRHLPLGPWAVKFDALPADTSGARKALAAVHVIAHLVRSSIRTRADPPPTANMCRRLQDHILRLLSRHGLGLMSADDLALCPWPLNRVAHACRTIHTSQASTEIPLVASVVSNTVRTCARAAEQAHAGSVQEDLGGLKSSRRAELRPQQHQFLYLVLHVSSSRDRQCELRFSTLIPTRRLVEDTDL